MIHWNWIIATSSELLMVLLSGVGIFVVLLIFTRLAGLRSFSKMSSFDFSITVAFGSVIATTILNKNPSLIIGTFAIALLFGIQYSVSKCRRLSRLIERLVDNEPLPLVARDDVLSENLSTVRMTEDDLRSKLRGAGITHPNQVLAAVMETTGDVSVLKLGDEVDLALFVNVRDAEKLK